VKIFDRDLKHDGILKRDERGRTLDVHALRTTFGTLLSKGVPLRTAQAAMRHSDPSLTANVYTDPRLLDVHGALDALPSLPLGSEQTAMRERARATGTETYGDCSVALPIALTPDKPGQAVATAVKMISPGLSSAGADRSIVSGLLDKAKGEQTTPVNPGLDYARQDLNLQPLAPEAAQSDRAKAAETLSPTGILASHTSFAKPLRALREIA
jgi:hypothetical protein